MFVSQPRPSALRLATVGALTAGVVLTGCSNSGSVPKTPKPGSAVSAADLASRMTKAEQAAKFVHVTQVSTGGSPVQVDLKFTATGRDLQLMDGTTPGMRAINGDYWLYSSDATDGKPWMAVHKSDTSKTATAVRKAMVVGAAGYGTSDPQQFFAQGSATFVGTDKTGQHYKVSVPAAPVYASLVSDASAGDQATLKGKTVTYDVWLGAKDRPAKVVLNATAFKSVDPEGSSGAAPSMNVSYSNWGKTVTITPPPAAQTVPVEQRVGDVGTGQ